MPSKINFTQIFDDNRKIIIPIIQRDYAQGRTDPHATKVRGEFLDALYQAIIKKPITLDFIYGDIDGEGKVTLLDGQQRITTLFLLYWYAAKKAKLPPARYEFLRRFGYETRYSSRQFCEKLVDYQPDFSSLNTLSSDIEDQNWFPLGWKKDPTISSMLKISWSPAAQPRRTRQFSSASGRKPASNSGMLAWVTFDSSSATPSTVTA